jgi:hypothetical protein
MYYIVALSIGPEYVHMHYAADSIPDCVAIIDMMYYLDKKRIAVSVYDDCCIRFFDGAYYERGYAIGWSDN